MTTISFCFPFYDSIRQDIKVRLRILRVWENFAYVSHILCSQHCFAYKPTSTWGDTQPNSILNSLWHIQYIKSWMLMVVCAVRREKVLIIIFLHHPRGERECHGIYSKFFFVVYTICSIISIKIPTSLLFAQLSYFSKYLSHRNWMQRREGQLRRDSMTFSYRIIFTGNWEV